MFHFTVVFSLLIVLISGCSVNPVTGKREFTLVSEAQEISIGQKQYLPSRQMQGGVYRVDPDLTRYVNQVGHRLAAVSDRKLPYEFVVLNNSVPNAWALPGGKIAVNRGLLLELGSEAELAAVLGHEIVHAAARHGAKGMERGMLLQGVILATGIAARDSDYANLAVGGAQLAASLLNQKYGREAERQSDLYGTEYMKRAGYDPQAAVALQETFVRLSKDRKSNWFSGLFSSHPPSQERVENNRATIQRLGAGGEMGKQRYLKKIARIRKTKPAYDAYDQGRKALAKNDFRKAFSLAKKALAIEPREGHFYALRGDAFYTQHRYRDALASYNRAMKLNSEFFHYFVQRGLTRQELGDALGAQIDLEKSTRLLPTATALNGLGELALQRRDRRSAVEYFRAAAGSKSDPGRKAARSLVLLDLPQNPGRYLKTRPGLNRSGYLMTEVANPTSVSVNRIELIIQYPDESGRMRQFSEYVHGTIPSGRTIRVKTRLGPIADRALLRNIRIIVSRASIVN